MDDSVMLPRDQIMRLLIDIRYETRQAEAARDASNTAATIHQLTGRLQGLNIAENLIMHHLEHYILGIG